MSNWQGWVVALLLLFCAVRIGMSIYSFFVGQEKEEIRAIRVQLVVN